ncbi:MAG TPA: HDOD domain-containing protein [Burkholderiaceae bacterium]|nr:HDOD domain-containing protein [Burkholderiaceae bacterium]
MPDSASPTAPSPAADLPPGVTGDAAFDVLLGRMQAKGDFPALSDSVSRIVEITSSEKGSVADLADQILRDVALTQKLLRLVNSVHFAHPGRSGVSSVSRAVILVGFNAVRNMALSVVLMEHMKDKVNTGQLKQDFLHAMLAGSLAGELCAVPHDVEDAFVGAMFQNLGRMLAGFYFPGEAAEVRRLVVAGQYASGEDGASAKTLGVSYENLGINVAKLWGMPETLLRCMRKPSGVPPPKPPDQPLERLRWTTLAASEIADVLLTAEPAQQAPRLARLAERYARTLTLTPKGVEAAILKARQKLKTLAQALRLDLTMK